MPPHNPADAPGAPNAVVRGCRCPQAKNRYGAGAGTNGRGEPMHFVDKRCPLHGDEKYRKEPA